MRRFWRGLFFLILITALCGGMALPILNVPARAAPQIQVASDLVISEFRFRGSAGASDEFVEIYNPTTSPINLNGWQVRGSNNSGGAGNRYTFSTNIFLQPGQHYLIAHTGYNDAVAADATYGTGITDDGGVGLIRPDGSIADQAGLSAGSIYQEGTFLPSLAGSLDQSYERRLGGAQDSCQDTNDNSADFQLLNPSLPQNASSPISLCGGVPPTATSTSTPTDTATVTNTGTATHTPTNTTVVTNTPIRAGNIVISEFRTTGPSGGNDEFIELYNRSVSSVSIGNYVIRKSNGCSQNSSVVTTIPAGVTLVPGQHYLIGGNSYSGSVAADQSAALSIANDGGISLLRANGTTIVDQVGMCANTLYHEGTPLTPLSTSTNRSYDRKSNQAGICRDSNNNAADFIQRNPSDPQNSRSPLTACGNATLTPTTTRTPTPTRTPTRTRTPSRTPSPPPPPPLIAINEFVPRPGHDWNNDGVINVGDEYIELLNHGVIDVNLSGYTLDDEVNVGSTPYRLPSVTLRPGERIVFYGSQTSLLLSDGGDGVRLIRPNGQLGDAYNYRVVRFPDQSYCRLPDNGGLDDWNENCFPTPGLQNSLSGSSVSPPTSGDVEQLCPIADTLPNDFLLAECPPFGNNIWNPAYWDRTGWFGEKFLPQSPGKWNVFVE